MKDLSLVQQVEAYRFYRAVRRFPGSSTDWTLGEYVALRSLLVLTRLEQGLSHKKLYSTLLRSLFKEAHAYAGEFVFFDDALSGFYPEFIRMLWKNLGDLNFLIEYEELYELWEKAQKDELLRELDEKLKIYFLEGGDPWYPEEAKIVHLAERMRQTSRYSGIVLVTPDRLLDHTAEVAFLAALMTMSRNHEDDGFRENPGVVLAKSLVHDIDEAVYGDIVRPVKYGIPGLKAALEAHAREWIRKELPYLERLWSESKLGSSGAIVKFADLLSVLLEVAEESRLGSTYIFMATQNYPKYMREVADQFRRAKSPYGEWLSELAEKAIEAYQELSK